MITGAWSYNRQVGKQIIVKDSIAKWCANSKKGSRMILASPYGNFIIEYKGIWKSDNCTKINSHQLTEKE